MRSIIALCLFLSAVQAYEYDLTPVKVSKDVHCFFGALENITKENGGNMVNTCFVQTKEGFVVIDSGYNLCLCQRRIYSNAKDR